MSMTAKRLKAARHTRSLIANTFSALDNDQTNVTEILGSPPSCLTRIRVYDVLRRVPRLGRDGAENVLSRAKVWPLTAMGNLTVEERRRILSALPPRVKQ